MIDVVVAFVVGAVAAGLGLAAFVLRVGREWRKQ